MAPIGTLWTVPEQVSGKVVSHVMICTVLIKKMSFGNRLDQGYCRPGWPRAVLAGELRALRRQQEARVLVQVPSRKDPCFRRRGWLQIV